MLKPNKNVACSFNLCRHQSVHCHTGSLAISASVGTLPSTWAHPWAMLPTQPQVSSATTWLPEWSLYLTRLNLALNLSWIYLTYYRTRPRIISDFMYQNHRCMGISAWSQTLNHYSVHFVLSSCVLGEKNEKTSSNKRLVCKQRIVRSNFLFMFHSQFKPVIILRPCKIQS